MVAIPVYEYASPNNTWDCFNIKKEKEKKAKEGEGEAERRGEGEDNI